jgi:hypothetical protein
MGADIWVVGEGERVRFWFKEDFDKRAEDKTGVLPFKRAGTDGAGLASVLDLVGVVVRDVGVSRRLKGEPLEAFDRLDESTLESFLIAELLVGTDLRCVDFSRNGNVVCGGVDGREREGNVSGWVLLNGPVFSEEGGTVIEIKVSTKRDLMTFSKHF